MTNDTINYRRINIGFKPAGKDEMQDQAFEILKALSKRGAKAEFIAKAIMEYVETHQRVIGSDRLGAILVLATTKNSAGEKINITRKRDVCKVTLPQKNDVPKLPNSDVMLEYPTIEVSMGEKEADRINALLDHFTGQ